MRNKRPDGTLLKTEDSFHDIIPYMMPKRTEAEVSITESFDVTELYAFMDKYNSENGTNLKLFHAFCTAIARTIYLRPKMNIFIAGRKYWMRDKISLSFVAKRQFSDGAEESMVFLDVEPEMNIESISKLIIGDVNKAKGSGKSDADKTLDIVAKLPRVGKELLFSTIRFFEYHALTPKAIMKGDPNYSTVLLSNLGSIGAGAPYHHLSNYGTCGIMITIGTATEKAVLMPDGKSHTRKILEATFTIDERIADGFYYAKSLKITKYLLEHPESLLEAVSEEVPIKL